MICNCSISPDFTAFFVISCIFTYLEFFRLHKEICDFYEYVKPKPHEERIRQHIVSRISDALHQHTLFRRTNIRSFGSFASGLYLPTADMDLVLNSSQYERTGERTLGQTRVLWTAASQIEKAGISSGKVQVISRARVPIIKFVDSITKVKVDISFDNSTGVIANQTLQEWKAQFPALLPLIAIIKQFLLMRNLNEVQFGGLGGCSITCLVTSLLQHHPAIQSGKMIPEHHLGQLLIEFFDLYGNKFNRNTTGIMMRPPSYFPKVWINFGSPTYTNFCSSTILTNGQSLTRTSRIMIYLVALTKHLSSKQSFLMHAKH